MYGPGELDIGRHVLADGTPRPSVSACFFRKVRKPPKKAGEVSCLDTRPSSIRAAEESEKGLDLVRSCPQAGFITRMLDLLVCSS